jgi:hypothetical protein
MWMNYLRELQNSMVLWLGLGLVIGGGLFLLFQGLRNRALEKRLFPRRAVESSCEVLVSGPFAGPLAGCVVNRSEGGVALLLQREMDCDLICSIRAVAATPEVPWIKVRVCHCTWAGRGWLVGCEFAESVPYKAMAWFN